MYSISIPSLHDRAKTLIPNEWKYCWAFIHVNANSLINTWRRRTRVDQWEQFPSILEASRIIKHLVWISEYTRHFVTRRFRIFRLTPQRNFRLCSCCHLMRAAPITRAFVRKRALPSRREEKSWPGNFVAISRSRPGHVRGIDGRSIFIGLACRRKGHARSGTLCILTYFSRYLPRTQAIYSRRIALSYSSAAATVIESLDPLW